VAQVVQRVVQIKGSQIAWTKDVMTGELTRDVTKVDGSITTMTIPGGGDITLNETFIGPIMLLNSTDKVRN
jgi:hypothetical protein